ncbi:MAG: hypothetical protein BZ135_01970 [Methanosphaera sp. rholeuAM6]|nr:MAG: hypothetical protein BZ135_01970 [Methanosphaera sp. rholeuAM6]
MMDNKGQLALEYLLIFFIFIIILSVISIPLLTDSIESTEDMTKAVETKNFLTEIQKNVKLIYSLDVGSKRTFSVYVPCDMNLNSNFTSYNVRTTLTLSDNTRKTISVDMPCKVSFNGNINYYYVSLKKGWYYNTEVKWYTSSSGERSINVNFK